MEEGLINELKEIEDEKENRKRQKAELIREWDEGKRDEWVVLSSGIENDEEVNDDDQDNDEFYLERGHVVGSRVFILIVVSLNQITIPS